MKNMNARLHMKVYKFSQTVEIQKKVTKSQLYKKNYRMKQINKKKLSENNELKKTSQILKGEAGKAKS